VSRARAAGWALAVCAVLACLAPPAARAEAVGSAQFRALAARAVDDPAALAELRRVDRVDARRVLLFARSANAVLIGILCLLVATSRVELWMVYAIALALGVATAFVFPAGASILPRMLEPRLLPAANGVLMSVRQLSFFVGPLLAGLLIARFPGGSDASGTAMADAHGIAFAFGIDALTFVASIVSLLLIRIAPAPSARARNVLHSIAEGLHGVWRDVSLRSYLLYVSLVAFFVGGPVQVGLPLLAEQRLHAGAASFGTLMSAHGAGVLLGTLLTGAGVLSPRGRLGVKLLSIDIGAGLLLAALALVQSTWIGVGLLLPLGIASGFVQVAMFSWIQQRIPPERMGRTMAVVMFVFIGVAPISSACAGLALRNATLTEMFVAAGLALSAIALAGTRLTSIRDLRSGDAPRPSAA
jgi:MFS family permease